MKLHNLKNITLTLYDMKGHPKFKARNKCKISFSCMHRAYFKYDKNSSKLKGLFVQKIKDPIKVKTNFTLPNGIQNAQFKLIHNPRIVFEHGKWLFCYVQEIPVKDIQLRKYNLGIDLGIRKLAVIAFGQQIKIYKNINKTNKRIKRLERNLKHVKRNIARKVNAHKKYNKDGSYSKALNYEIKRLQKIYYKLSNIRKNYIHHVTKDIINLLPNSIVYEDLNIMGLLQNHSLAKTISNQLWYEVRRQIEYKAEYYGINLILANHWYPSSKLCSNCSNKKKYFGHDVIYHCDSCGLIIDRDINAALNLKSLASQ